MKASYMFTTILVFFNLILICQIPPQNSPYYYNGTYSIVADSDLTTSPTIYSYRPVSNSGGPYPVFMFQLGANGFGSSAINVHSYDLYLKHLASYGYVVIIVNDPVAGFPTGTSFSTVHNWFKTNSKNISHWMNQYADTNNVAIGGHSNGGVNATAHLLNHQTEIDAIVYFASYPSSPFPNHIVTNYTGKVLDLAGTEDNTSTPSNCKAGFNKFTSSTCRVWALITGLNHGGFGDYVNSSQPIGSIGRNDATATIRHYLVSFMEAEFKNNTNASNQLFIGSNRPNSTNEFITNCSLITGIESQNFTQNLSIFPNPTKEKIMISYITENSSAIQIELCDVSGRLILKETENPKKSLQTTKEINIESIDNGSYILYLNQNGYKKAFKIIKQ